MVEKQTTEPSAMYKAMIYFVVGQLHFYRDIIKPNHSMGRFSEENKLILKRIFDDGLKDMNYELSHEQMSSGIAAYMMDSTTLESKDD